MTTIHKKRTFRLRVIIVCLSLFIIGDVTVITIGAISLFRHQAFIKSMAASTGTGAPAPATQTVASNGAIANPYKVEQPPASQLKNYQAPATHPKYITISKLAINTRVLSMGLTSDGAIDVPTNGYDTVWYNGSSLPGKPGATFIDGHVDGYYEPGVFYYLKDLVAGDTIQLTLGDNTKLTYVVRTTKTYDASSVDMKQALSPIDPTKPGLNLMTCTGTLTEKTETFNKRLVVYSILKS